VTVAVTCEMCDGARAAYNLTSMPGSPFGVPVGRSADVCAMCLLATTAVALAAVEDLTPPSATAVAVRWARTHWPPERLTAAGIDR
jgi:hypothetical protein